MLNAWFRAKRTHRTILTLRICVNTTIIIILKLKNLWIDGKSSLAKFLPKMPKILLVPRRYQFAFHDQPCMSPISHSSRTAFTELVFSVYDYSWQAIRSYRSNRSLRPRWLFSICFERRRMRNKNKLFHIVSDFIGGSLFSCHMTHGK